MNLIPWCGRPHPAQTVHTRQQERGERQSEKMAACAAR
jgi:hypothetical protein